MFVYSYISIGKTKNVIKRQQIRNTAWTLANHNHTCISQPYAMYVEFQWLKCHFKNKHQDERVLIFFVAKQKNVNEKKNIFPKMLWHFRRFIKNTLSKEMIKCTLRHRFLDYSSAFLFLLSVWHVNDTFLFIFLERNRKKCILIVIGHMENAFRKNALMQRRHNSLNSWQAA